MEASRHYITETRGARKDRPRTFILSNAVRTQLRSPRTPRNNGGKKTRFALCHRGLGHRAERPGRDLFGDRDRHQQFRHIAARRRARPLRLGDEVTVEVELPDDPDKALSVWGLAKVVRVDGPQSAIQLSAGNFVLPLVERAKKKS